MSIEYHKDQQNDDDTKQFHSRKDTKESKQKSLQSWRKARRNKKEERRKKKEEGVVIGSQFTMQHAIQMILHANALHAQWFQRSEETITQLTNTQQKDTQQKDTAEINTQQRGY